MSDRETKSDVEGATDAHEQRAKEFVAKVDATLLRIVADPKAIFAERLSLHHDLRELLSDEYRLGRSAGRESISRVLEMLLKQEGRS
jgi:hypothetical protein